jgi:hypothetical protein
LIGEKNFAVLVARGAACDDAGMPLALVGRTKDAVVSLPTGVPWRDGVRSFLSGLTDDADRVERHLDLLANRAAGRLPWRELLSGSTLPNGRPMPPARRYAEMLVVEDRLPLYTVEGLTFSLDLHNPGNEAAVPNYDTDHLELALVADVGAFTPNVPRSSFPEGLPPEQVARLRAARGAVLGDLVARLVESTSADFAYADIQATGWIVDSASRPGSVVHPAPRPLRPWDFLWSITAWGPERLDPALAARLQALQVTDQMRADLDSHYRDHIHIHRRGLQTGGLLLQYRWHFGDELRSTRHACDTPLARQAGLLSTALQFRA